MNGTINRWRGFTILVIAIGVILLSACGPAAATQPPPTPTLNALDLVHAFETAQNNHDISKVMALFTDDASLIDIEGNVLTLQEKIQKYIEYNEGINQEIHFTNCQVSGISVKCNYTSTDDCTKAFGLNPLPGTYYFILSNNKIKIITENRFWNSPEFIQAFEIYERFTAWFDKNYPDEWAAINVSDESWTTRETGYLLIKRCLEFQESQE